MLNNFSFCSHASRPKIKIKARSIAKCIFDCVCVGESKSNMAEKEQRVQINRPPPYVSPGDRGCERARNVR